MRGKKANRIYDNGVLVAKECTKCHEIKVVSEFNKKSSSKDGLRSECKQCKKKDDKQYRVDNSEHIKQYREDNKEYIKEYAKQYYVDNKEYIKERQKQYREDNKEYIKEYNKQYHENNKEFIRELHKQYYENNKEYIKEYSKQYYEDNKEYRKEYNKQWCENNKEYSKQYYENNKEYIKEYSKQYYDSKTQEAIQEVYKKVTKKLYPHNGIQYGIIYGVHNIITNRWYIGQTTTSFEIRYNGNFFKTKVNEISEESSQLLVEDIETYGQESFQIHEVLDVAFSEEELDALEVYYIDKYKAYDEGYNSNRGNINGKRSYREN